ncbi:MAG TPA: hypothetical protein VF468_04995, partial [Actinomycetota bacterium]|nr:hypothetical protein [Actinomycetota bacterium]
TLDRYGHLFRATMTSCATAWTPCTLRASRPFPVGAVVELPGGPARAVTAPARPTAKQANKKTRRKSGPDLG